MGGLALLARSRWVTSGGIVVTEGTERETSNPVRSDTDRTAESKHPWPPEQSPHGSIKPWFFSATGFLFALFPDGEEAKRAETSLVEQGVSQDDLRLYTSKEVLSMAAERAKGSSVARAIFTITADPNARELYLETAKSGGAVLWAFAPEKQAANRLLRMLANYDYRFVRYYGEEGTVDVSEHEGRPSNF
jgi:hypothetical protein